MKDTLIEKMQQFTGNDNRVDEVKNQINELEHKEEKTTNQSNKKKKEYKKVRIV